MKRQRVAVIGATGNVGRALVAALLDQGEDVVMVARTAAHFQNVGRGVVQWQIDLDKDSLTLRRSLEDVTCVINVAHARYTRAIIAALPDTAIRLVTLGSTRKFTTFPDRKSAEVQDAEAAHADGVNGVILHASMIYGGRDNNISRVLRIVRLSPVIPLPRHGDALVQPIHRDDVVRCLLAAISKDAGDMPLTIAGGEVVSYAGLVLACSAALGRRAGIISMPLWVVLTLARVSQFIPGVPSIKLDEVRRLLEDKAFDIASMRARLGVTPCTLEEGLARMAAAGEIAGRNAV